VIESQALIYLFLLFLLGLFYCQFNSLYQVEKNRLKIILDSYGYIDYLTIKAKNRKTGKKQGVGKESN